MPISKRQRSKPLSSVRGDVLHVQHDLVSLFLQHVKQSPDQLAIKTSEVSWRYQELFDDVCAWRARLTALAIKGPVVICFNRTPRLISMLIALQWCKIPYIPIGPHMPIERVRVMLADSKAEVLLHNTTHGAPYDVLPCRVYALDDLEKTIPAVLADTEHVAFDANAIAYIIYTSGSTGTPKGVSVSHGALSNFLSSMSQTFLKHQDDMLLATTTLTFDIAALELYLPIWQKKPLFLASNDEHKDPLLLQAILKTHPITLLQGTPSFWLMLHYVGWQEKKDLVALCGGEALTPQTAKIILPKVASLWNMYGPTEATIWCALAQIQHHQNITIGKPIHNLSLHVLDENMRPLPMGAKGELYIGGAGLAEGYRNQATLTATRFVSCKALKGKRLYQTGDIAYMTPQGEFVVLGRVDNQVKLHGYRIELEDIEAHIQSYPGVRSCAASVYQEQLIAYLCLEPAVDYKEEVLVEKLSHELPEFMLPKRFIYLEDLPLNSSGKLDRKALPEPQIESHEVIEENLTPTELLLHKIWCDVLNLSSLSIHDNFFELGGHSLLAVRIVMKVRERLEKALQISDIYAAPTVTELSQRLETLPSCTQEVSQYKKRQFFNWMPMTDFQLVLWMSHLFRPAVKQLNVVERRRLKGPLDKAALNEALQMLVEKHEVLSYAVHRFLPLQKKHTKKSVTWEYVECKEKEVHHIGVYLNQSIKALAAHRTWCKNKPLIIAKCIALCDDQVELQIAMPHMVSDQHSLDVFFQDLSCTYLLLVRKTVLTKQAKDELFETYVQKDHHVARSSLSTGEVFWKKYLKDTGFLAFPKHRIEPYDSTQSYSSFFEINEDQLTKWRDFCKQHAVTLNDLLCAAIGKALHQFSKTDVSLPQHVFVNRVKSTRENPALDKVMGCFLCAQPIKLDLHTERDLKSFIQQVQQSVVDTTPHQSVSSLIKLASIGRFTPAKRQFKARLLAFMSAASGRIKKSSYYFSGPMLRACKRLASIDDEPGFIINVNIWDSFFKEKKQTGAALFGVPCQPIPVEETDILVIHDVLDVCLLRDTSENKAFLVLSANLTPAFRQSLGERLLDVLDA